MFLLFRTSRKVLDFYRLKNTSRGALNSLGNMDEDLVSLVLVWLDEAVALVATEGFHRSKVIGSFSSLFGPASERDVFGHPSQGTRSLPVIDFM